MPRSARAFELDGGRSTVNACQPPACAPGLEKMLCSLSRAPLTQTDTQPTNGNACQP